MTGGTEMSLMSGSTQTLCEMQRGVIRKAVKPGRRDVGLLKLK